MSARGAYEADGHVLLLHWRAEAGKNGTDPFP